MPFCFSTIINCCSSVSSSQFARSREREKEGTQTSESLVRLAPIMFTVVLHFASLPLSVSLSIVLPSFFFPGIVLDWSILVKTRCQKFPHADEIYEFFRRFVLPRAVWLCWDQPCLDRCLASSLDLVQVDQQVFTSPKDRSPSLVLADTDGARITGCPSVTG